MDLVTPKQSDEILTACSASLRSVSESMIVSVVDYLVHNSPPHRMKETVSDVLSNLNTLFFTNQTTHNVPNTQLAGTTPKDSKEKRLWKDAEGMVFDLLKRECTIDSPFSSTLFSMLRLVTDETLLRPIHLWAVFFLQPSITFGRQTMQLMELWASKGFLSNRIVSQAINQEHTIALEGVISTVTEIASSLLIQTPKAKGDASKSTLSTMKASNCQIAGRSLFVNTFIALSNSPASTTLQQDILSSLLNFVGSTHVPTATAALETFVFLCTNYTDVMRRYSAFVQALVDYIGGLKPQQVALVFKAACVLACGGEAMHEGLKDVLNILIRKELMQCHEFAGMSRGRGIKQSIGIVGTLAYSSALSVVIRKEGKHHDEEWKEEQTTELEQLIAITREKTSKQPVSISILNDGLAGLIDSYELVDKVTYQILDTVSDEMEDYGMEIPGDNENTQMTPHRHSFNERVNGSESIPPIERIDKEKDGLDGVVVPVVCFKDGDPSIKFMFNELRGSKFFPCSFFVQPSRIRVVGAATIRSSIEAGNVTPTDTSSPFYPSFKVISHAMAEICAIGDSAHCLFNEYVLFSAHKENRAHPVHLNMACYALYMCACIIRENINLFSMCTVEDAITTTLLNLSRLISLERALIRWTSLSPSFFIALSKIGSGLETNTDNESMKTGTPSIRHPPSQFKRSSTHPPHIAVFAAGGPLPQEFVKDEDEAFNHEAWATSQTGNNLNLQTDKLLPFVLRPLRFHALTMLRFPLIKASPKPNSYMKGLSLTELHFLLTNLMWKLEQNDKRIRGERTYADGPARHPPKREKKKGLWDDDVIDTLFCPVTPADPVAITSPILIMSQAAPQLPQSLIQPTRIQSSISDQHVMQMLSSVIESQTGDENDVLLLSALVFILPCLMEHLKALSTVCKESLDDDKQFQLKRPSHRRRGEWIDAHFGIEEDEEELVRMGKELTSRSVGRNPDEKDNDEAIEEKRGGRVILNDDEDTEEERARRAELLAEEALEDRMTVTVSCVSLIISIIQHTFTTPHLRYLPSLQTENGTSFIPAPDTILRLLLTSLCSLIAETKGPQPNLPDFSVSNPQFLISLLQKYTLKLPSMEALIFSAVSSLKSSSLLQIPLDAESFPLALQICTLVDTLLSLHPSIPLPPGKSVEATTTELFSSPSPSSLISSFTKLVETYLAHSWSPLVFSETMSSVLPPSHEFTRSVPLVHDSGQHFIFTANSLASLITLYLNRHPHSITILVKIARDDFSTSLREEMEREADTQMTDTKRAPHIGTLHEKTYPTWFGCVFEKLNDEMKKLKSQALKKGVFTKEKRTKQDDGSSDESGHSDEDTDAGKTSSPSLIATTLGICIDTLYSLSEFAKTVQIEAIIILLLKHSRFFLHLYDGFFVRVLSYGFKVDQPATIRMILSLQSVTKHLHQIGDKEIYRDQIERAQGTDSSTTKSGKKILEYVPGVRKEAEAITIKTKQLLSSNGVDIKIGTLPPPTGVQRPR
ncbi:putative Fanconi anemia protein FancD2 nuclease [Blattamonas nauphoetae]|uniref:Fanconi anemia protein FancD2 nuclease n=1 Tax=Blattamonas nauphoetae TaxID=2049346 RepID=A0ABQ9YD00_9EUKA|nr:putative Fanconi anemia protein FancD2 nuclease [Blattamonas nauphoetae]